MPRKKQMDDIQEVDTLDEYAELKKEITELVASLGVNQRLAITGDRNYELEADGTLWMQYGHGQDNRRAINRWRKREWTWFQEDLSCNRLKERLEALRND